ncbi:TetR/AcrR family transcriptional regulator [Olsenella profusa]|uniref:Transcriptional regulator, TetR family n=1 Tax=Olsenella profusa F0195 TaxID=1125712 RepID=U2T6P2_9ACTN|nr:TetR/AcrR family transcriptional regulator [Olsenella profusa]ERL08724.1 transcriptional regulator, TetR family [Olsenella profusa F0195]
MRETGQADRRGTSVRAVRARETWQGERLRSTRSRLRSCGLRLIAERGYDETTARDIAQAAGVSVMTFFRHFPSKEDVILGMPPDSAAIVVAERTLGTAGEDARPLDVAHTVLDAVVGELGGEGLSDVALRLAIVHENPTLLRALYARVPRWEQVVATLLSPSLRTDDDDFATHLTAAAMVLYWVEVMREWSHRGGTDADAALLRTVADEAGEALAASGAH